MWVFSTIIDYIKNKKQIKKIYDPFFKKKDQELLYLRIVDSHTSSSVTNIYKALKKYPKKYKQLIDKYEMFSNIVAEHNCEVEKLQNIINSFSFESVLENPKQISKSQISELHYCQENANKFKTSGEQRDKINKIQDVAQNLNEIIRQYVLWINSNNLFNSIPRKYLDRNFIHSFLLKINNLKNNLSVVKEYYSFRNLRNAEDVLRKHNKEYVAANINDKLFDNVNEKSLDREQREAILKDDNVSLTVAGAGSGKTLTICGKVKYLLEHEKIDANEILLLSYSTKSKEDLENKVRLINNRINVGTFHKIGLDILKESENKKFMIEEQFNAIIESYFRKEMPKRQNAMERILTYYAMYSSNERFNKQYKNKGELYDELKLADLTTLKSSIYGQSKETILKEHVKSFEELAIANFYFLNGIDYTYEAPYEKKVNSEYKRQYTPDFFLNNYGIYHEHYGVNKEGRATQYSKEENRKYEEDMDWKRNLHKQNETTCIETYSYEFKEGTVFENLKKRLIDAGVSLHPISANEVSNAINSIYENYNFKSFINLVKSFISLYKSKYSSEGTFDILKEMPFENMFEKQRANIFLDICKEIYIYYIDYLKKEDKIDFDDMILKSIHNLKHLGSFKYKYIIVDEFQDISYSRMEFLKALIEHGDSKLFAVGDDWQAIYRFAGCDINIFLGFENYFGKSTINCITTTHRNSQELQDIAGLFIKKNRQQIDKRIKSEKHLTNPIKVIYYRDNKYEAFQKILQIIAENDECANILVLGRNNYDINTVLSANLYFEKGFENKSRICSLDYPKLNITYSTVHGSKGLEDDYVIIINADDARLGFPNKVEDDYLLGLVLSNKNEIEFAEERRLWYVALTRTRTYTYILTNKDFPSEFVKEIENNVEIINPNFISNDLNVICCPECKSGKLIKKVNLNGTAFFGCSHYPYCKYTIDDMSAVKRNKRCRLCGDFMVYRKGQYGAFWGCHNYPNCTYKEKYMHK